MLRKSKDGVHWLEFESLADIPSLKHAVFLRHGGSSQGKFASFNLSYGLGDVPEHVEANLKKAASLLNLPKLIWGQQHHGKTVALVSDDFDINRRCDALATSLPEMGLLIHHADCQAAILYDPMNRAVANVHSGWKGSVQNIYRETIHFMHRFFRTKPENVLACISPSLGPENAEFINYRVELPELFWKFQIKPNYFDFWEISKMQLMECGVLDHHIEIAGISTTPIRKTTIPIVTARSAGDTEPS